MDDRKKAMRETLRAGFAKYCREYSSGSYFLVNPVKHSLNSGWQIDNALLDTMVAELQAADKHRERVRVRVVLHTLGLAHDALDDKIDDIIAEADEVIAAATRSEKNA